MKINYKTGQRNLIKKYLMENEEKFVNVENISNYMKHCNQTVGIATIYRYLNLLEKNDNVRTETRGHTKYYQYIANECLNHFHLKCKKCGQILHLECDEFEKINKHIEQEHKFKLDNNTIIYGLCAKCS